MVSLSRIGILGAGRVGSALARVAVDAGLQARVSGSGPADAIKLITEVLIPGAEARDAAGAVEGADVVILAVPLHKYATVDPALVDGKVLIDVLNYWEPIDGHQPSFEDAAHSSSEVVQAHFAGARVVKTFNHVGYHELELWRRPAGAADRQAVGIASDDEPAAQLVAELVDRMGFTPVQLGALANGRILEPGGPFFGARHTEAEFREILAAQEPGAVPTQVTGGSPSGGPARARR